jgi:hypothetical protein
MRRRYMPNEGFLFGSEEEAKEILCERAGIESDRSAEQRREVNRLLRVDRPLREED